MSSQVHNACVPIIQSTHPLQDIINCDVHTHTWIAHFKLNWVFNVFWPQFRQVSQTAQKCYSTCHVSTLMYFGGRWHFSNIFLGFPECGKRTKIFLWDAWYKDRASIIVKGGHISTLKYKLRDGTWDYMTRRHKWTLMMLWKISIQHRARGVWSCQTQYYVIFLKNSWVFNHSKESSALVCW